MSISALYFRGKLSYSRRFGRRVGGPSTLVITPDRGCVPVDTTVELADLRAMAGVDIDPTEPVYLAALSETTRELSSELSHDASVVLLGSIATGKYLDPLLEVFGRRLLVPERFVGLGEMQRGSLLLKAVEAGRELEYIGAWETRR